MMDEMGGGPSTSFNTNAIFSYSIHGQIVIQHQCSEISQDHKFSGSEAIPNMNN